MNMWDIMPWAGGLDWKKEEKYVFDLVVEELNDEVNITAGASFSGSCSTSTSCGSTSTSTTC